MSNLQSRWLLAIVLILAAAAGFMLGVPGGTPVLAAMLRAVLGVCLVLVGPGLAVTAALLPPQQLGSAEHVLAVFVTSIALAVIGGIVLNAAPWGLQPLSWAALLGVVTLAAALVALVRLRGRRMRAGARPRSRRGGSTPGAQYTASAPQVPTARLALPIVALVLLGMAVYVARMPAPADRFQGYTTLWMAPNAEQTAQGARIGVQSAEFESTSYRLEVRVNGQVAGIWPDLTLAPNQAWQAQVALPEATGAGMEVEALLYRSDAPWIVYRQVRFGHDETGLIGRAN